LDLASTRQRYRDVLETCAAIDERHGGQLFLDPDSKGNALQRALAKLESFEVTVPLVGAFSAGKSSLLNAFLGRRILKLDVNPTTAVPTELRFDTRERAEVVNRDGGTSLLTLEAFSTRDFHVDETPVVRLYLNVPALAAHPSVVLVDAPGLDSGLEAHNRVLDGYLPSSVAFLVAVDVDGGNVPNSVLNVLRELRFHERPLAVAVTKADHRMPDDVQDVVETVRRTVAGIFGPVPFKIFSTSVDEDVTGKLSSVLQDLSTRSPGLLARTHDTKIRDLAQRLRQYLMLQSQCNGFDPGELDRLIADHQAKITQLKADLSSHVAELERQLARASQGVVSRIHAALSANVGRLANAASNQAGFQGQINAIVREALLQGVRDEVEPVVQRSLDGIARDLAGGLGDLQLNVAQAVERTGNVDAGKGLEVLGGLGSIVTMLPLPPQIKLIVTLITGGIGLLAGLLGGSRPDPAEEESERQRVLQQRIESEAIPQVIDRLQGPIDREVTQLAAEVRKSAEDSVEAQHQILVAALEGLKAQRGAAEEQVLLRKARINEDLSALERALASLPKLGG
jgi:GTP-binding protein EngB required for normal cell division